MRKHTRQEKKELCYKRDRRNVYGESPHASRKNVPLRKAIRNRANRHVANQSLAYQGPVLSEDIADELESRVHRRAPHHWENIPMRRSVKLYLQIAQTKNHARARWPRRFDYSNIARTEETYF